MNSQTLPPPRARRAPAVTLLCAALLLPAAFALARVATASGPLALQEVETTFRWQAQPGVSRYRLQVALDPRFTDIVFDGAINGLEQKVPLAPGTYYWRYAAAPKETGRFSTPIRIDVPRSGASVSVAPTPTAAPVTTPTRRPTPAPRTTPTPIARVTPTPSPRITPTPLVRVTPTPAPTTLAPQIIRPPASVGWEAVTGMVDRVVPVRLRAGQSQDFVAVNSDGTVYALEGPTGVALWTARYVPGRQPGGASRTATGQTFTPVAVAAPQGDTSNVLVAYEGGVRLLEGETGRELWRAALATRATSGCAADLDGDEATQEVAVATEDQQLYVLGASGGAVVSQTKLDNELIGPPIPFAQGAERGIALTLKGAQVEVRKADGKRLRGVKFDVGFVTPPLVIAGPRGTLVIVGSEHGLLFMDGALKPLGRITTEGESPRGRLGAADLDGDGVVEIVAVTSRGRLIAVSGEGRIMWTAAGARDAYSPAFADLNGDGAPDVLAADSGVFARGFSGRDGAVIWQVDEDKTGAGGGEAQQLRALAVAAAGASAGPLVAGGDHTRGAVRAFGLPTGPARAGR